MADISIPLGEVLTTPNIEELIDRLRDPQTRGTTGEWFDRAVAADLLQSQAERIKELELDLDVQAGSIEAVQAANSRLAAERDTLRAELKAIAATEPVLVVEKEPDYWSGGHFHEGSKPHIKPTKVWCLPIGTQLFTHPMPAESKDAERYRWLRDYLISPSTHFDDLIVSADKADTLDGVIDAARAKGAK